MSMTRRRAFPGALKAASRMGFWRKQLFQIIMLLGDKRTFFPVIKSRPRERWG
jgi:hypothetical protein